MLTCSVCGGDANQRVLVLVGAHYLCLERAKHALPTPAMNECQACHGHGTQGTGGVPLFFSLGPATIARSIAAQFPPCPVCHGTGRPTER